MVFEPYSRVLNREGVSLYSVTGLATWYIEGSFLRSLSGWGLAFHVFLLLTMM